VNYFFLATVTAALPLGSWAEALAAPLDAEALAYGKQAFVGKVITCPDPSAGARGEPRVLTRTSGNLGGNFSTSFASV
jgi:hypothetical protein